MAELILKTGEVTGKMKPMHAVNNGPYRARNDQSRGNFDAYKAARIPYARNHDASHCAAYGGPHVVDVNNIFRDFNADPDDPAAYDFLLTDIYIQTTLEAGTETFYRLGASIEHWAKKYNTLPPPDFKKWAVICEHIIAHYTEGWADGFHHKLTYWEIWNEPDLDPDGSTNKRCWGGLAAEFYELFCITVTHLKKRFPNLKIGGPAIAGNLEWLDGLFQRMTRDEERVPLDFVSWHSYPTTPEQMVQRANLVRAKMKQHGYGDAESILNEWNYVRGWGGDEFTYSVRTINSLKGAAYTMACILAGQNNDVDMLMYYDARVTVFNGLFDYYDYHKLKGYYPFPVFADLYELKQQISCTSDDQNIYTVAAKGEDGTIRIAVCYYTDDDENVTDTRDICIRCQDADLSGMSCRIVDADRDLEEMEVTASADAVRFQLKPNTFVLLEKKA